MDVVSQASQMVRIPNSFFLVITRSFPFSSARGDQPLQSPPLKSAGLLCDCVFEIILDTVIHVFGDVKIIAHSEAEQTFVVSCT